MRPSRMKGPTDLLFLGCLALWVSLIASQAWGEPTAAPGGVEHKGTSRTDKPDDEDYSETPFTAYGEFNETRDEDADTKFFQYGRFFGVSLGLGYQFISGNRGALWQGGFPTIDFKVHYWFDFNFALDLDLTSSSHYFDTTVQGMGHVDANLFRTGIDLKYYFDTRDMSAPISFANPYVLIGIANFIKTQTSIIQNTVDRDSALGFAMGAGLEFAISPHKTYFELEGKVNFVTFHDTYTTIYQSAGIPDMTGQFYTVIGSVLITW